MNCTSRLVKLYRSIFDWEWWNDTNTTKVFIYCLLKANPSDKQWRAQIGFENLQYAFQVLIDKLSGFGTWDRNDWQFAYTFKLIK